MIIIKFEEIQSNLKTNAGIGNYKKIPRCVKMSYRTYRNKPHTN